MIISSLTNLKKKPKTYFITSLKSETQEANTQIFLTQIERVLSEYKKARSLDSKDYFDVTMSLGLPISQITGH